MTNPDGATQPKAEECEKGDFKKNLTPKFASYDFLLEAD